MKWWPVSLAELAALSGVSRFQLLRGFAREMGTTAHTYLVQRRVRLCRLARQLLSDGQTPAQAAFQAGFADQSHMTRAFVRQLGITPSRYQAAGGNGPLVMTGDSSLRMVRTYAKVGEQQLLAPRMLASAVRLDGHKDGINIF